METQVKSLKWQKKQQMVIVKTFKFKIGMLWATIVQKWQISEDFSQPTT
jgi:hypothetical protein